MKIAIIICALFAVSNAAPRFSGQFPAALSYGAWMAPAPAHAAWPHALSYGAWPNSGYYTATKSFNIAAPQPLTMTYASAPTWLAPAPAPAGSQYHAQDNLGQYSYGYASEDGQAKVENRAHDGTILGKYSYMDPTGRQVETRYRAGPNGFEVEGDHLPQAPETPELPEEVAEAYEKAREDFEEAKNRKGPSAPEGSLAEQQVAPISIAPSARFYSAHGRYQMPAAFSKSAHYNWN